MMKIDGASCPAGWGWGLLCWRDLYGRHRRTLKQEGGQVRSEESVIEVCELTSM